MTSDDEFTERDLDALFSGRAVRDPRLGDLAAAVAVLRSTSTAEPSQGAVAEMALAMSRAAAASVTVPAPRRAPRRAPALSRRLAAVAAAVGVFGIGVAGAAAADGAAPGDRLYGLDRALERIGINDGGAQERLAEVRSLVDRGDVDAALAHAEEATQDMDPDATQSLRTAAGAIASAGSARSSDVREQVAAMLMWMVDTDLEGREFGHGVAERARAIGAGPGRPDNAGPSTDTARPATGGRPEHAGPPADEVKRDKAVVPADKGTPKTVGPVLDKGKSEKVVVPAEKGKPDKVGPAVDNAKSDPSVKPEKSGPAADKGKPEGTGPPADKGKPENPGEQRGGPSAGRP
ncbi:MAG: hypothetical protein ACK4MD_04720 [Demequina sp.]